MQYNFMYLPAIEVKIGVYEEHFALVEQLNKKSECTAFDSFDWHDHQGMEFSLLCHAFELSGLDVEFTLVNMPNYHRALREMERNSIQLTAHALWAHDFNDKYMLRTHMVLDKNDTEIGLYINTQNSGMRDIQKKSQLKPFVAVTNINWASDVLALKCLGVDINNASGYEQMFQMIDKSELILY